MQGDAKCHIRRACQFASQPQKVEVFCIYMKVDAFLILLKTWHGGCDC